jgi:arylformamidase
MQIYDISRKIAPDTAVWPGDAPFSFDMALSRADGQSVNLTTIHLSPHTGTHADAGFHFTDTDEFPDQMPLEKYIGAAQVVTVEREHGAITPDDVSKKISGPVQRLLIHTWVSDLDDNQWPEDFPYPGVELIDWLADQGAVLLGMDSPSVDDFNSKDLAGHNRLRARGMAHLELLQLRGVPDGIYELVALPLKLWGVCGSPVRAILRG